VVWGPAQVGVTGFGDDAWCEEEGRGNRAAVVGSGGGRGELLGTRHSAMMSAGLAREFSAVVGSGASSLLSRPLPHHTCFLAASKSSSGRTRAYTRILPFASSSALWARLRATTSSRYTLSSSSRRLA
jgi:hypothetical protein